MQWKLLIWLLVHNSHECCFIIMTGELLMGSRTTSWEGPLKLQCMYASWRSYWNAHSHPVVLGWNSGCCVNSKYTYRWCQYYWATHHTLNCRFLDYKPTMPICWARKLVQWKQLPSHLLHCSDKRQECGPGEDALNLQLHQLWPRRTRVRWCNCPFKFPPSNSRHGTTLCIPPTEKTAPWISPKA